MRFDGMECGNGRDAQGPFGRVGGWSEQNGGVPDARILGRVRLIQRPGPKTKP